MRIDIQRFKDAGWEIDMGPDEIRIYPDQPNTELWGRAIALTQAAGLSARDGEQVTEAFILAIQKAQIFSLLEV